MSVHSDPVLVAPQAALTREREGSGGTPLLSLCVPTYNRAPRLARVLEQLIRVAVESPHASKLEVVVSNNASTDDTDAVVRAASDRFPPGFRLRAFTQRENVGGERNFKFLYEAARGDYVCLWGDDDDLDRAELDLLVADLERHRPEVALSSFANFGTGGDNVAIAGGSGTRIVTDLAEAVRQMYPLGKICQYVIRRYDLDAVDLRFSERAARETSFWFIALALWLVRTREGSLLLRSGTIGTSGKDSWDMRFSPRVYATKRAAVLMALGDDPLVARFERTLPVERIDNLVVGNLFRTCVGMAKMDESVALEEYRFLKTQLPGILFSGWRNLVKLPFILALFPLVRRIRYR